jgi:elongation factor P
MVKIDASKVKKWTVLEMDGQLFVVLDLSFMQMQQRQGSYTYKVRNLATNGVQNVTVKSWITLDQAEISTQNAVYLYNTGDTYSFMENDTWEIYDIDRDAIDDIVGYLKDNLDVYLQMYQGNVINVILPSTITYKITSTVPGVKWDRAQAWTKPATIETWMEIQVPLYKEAWDEVVVNTLTWTVN